MKYRVVLKQLLDGKFYARCHASPGGLCETIGNNREEVLQKMKDEIRYKIEWCACSGVSEDYVELDVHEERAKVRPPQPIKPNYKKWD